jgi:hypothetical protein
MVTEQPTPKPIPIADDISPEELIARYLAGPALVRGAIAGMDEGQLHARPIPDKMSSHGVVTHIVDSEIGLGGRVKRALAGEEPIVSQGGHPEIKSEPERDLETELARLEIARAEMAEKLRDLEADAWERVAMRREDRVVTVRQMIMLMTRHLENHVAAIDEKRAALGL